MEHLSQPLQFLDDFVRPRKPPSMDDDGAKCVTTLDVCSGRTDHINLKQVVSRCTDYYETPILVVSISLMFPDLFLM